jgi:hypothetical protein
MSTSDSKDVPGEVAEGFHASSNSPEPTESIWTTPLQQGQIRLFNIELDDSDDITGTLEIFDHKSAPEYVAQSYVCGEGECDFKITLNGIAHYIKPNLFVALLQTKRALRNPLPCLTRITMLWVDAICIDQNNVKELEMQIRFMEHIYRGADLTLVSLGECTESQRLISLVVEWWTADLEISRLQEEGESCSTDDNRALKIDAILSRQTRPERCLQTEFSMSEEDIRAICNRLEEVGKGRSVVVNIYSRVLSYQHPFWQACAQLFENDWFTRVWTYQELMLSRQVFVTLQTCVPWQMLQSWPESIIDLDLPMIRIEGDAATPTKAKWFHDYVTKHYHQHRSLRKLGADPDSIWALLIVTAQRRAKVPKDHVFAILALMDDETQSLVDVDYSKTDAQVFRGIIELALKTNNAAQTLPSVWEVLSWAPTTTFGLPSWMPELKNDTDARIGQQGSRMISKTALDTFWDAARLRVSHENGVLFLNVLEVDDVLRSGGGACPACNGGPLTLQVLNETISWIKGLYDTLFSSGDNPAVKIRRLRNFFGYAAIMSHDSEKILTFLLYESQLPDKDSHLDPGESSLRIVKERKPLQDLESWVEDLARIARAVRVSFEGMYFFATAGGRLGYSPKPVSPDDKICIAPGGKLLHVFSTAPSRYVTCAVVQGLMDDSLLDFVRESGRGWEEIAIH